MLRGAEGREREHETALEWSERVQSFLQSEVIPNIKRLFTSWVRSIPKFANQIKKGAASSSPALQPNTPLVAISEACCGPSTHPHPPAIQGML